MALQGMSNERCNKLVVGVVGEDGRSRTELKTLLASIDHPRIEVAEIDPMDAAYTRAEPDLSMVIFGANQDASIGYLQAQVRHSHRPALVAILPAHSPAATRRVLHAGADEVLIVPVDADDVSRTLIRLGKEHGRIEHGSIYSITSLCGGVGVTTLSGGLALALRYAFDQRVGIIDLDLQSGGLDAFLHVEPDRTILPLSGSGRKLEASKLEAALTRHASGVCLLAAPRRIEDSERVSDIAVGAALDLMRQLFDVVVVDCGRHVDANAVAAWERSEEVLYVLDQSAPAVRSVARFRELFAQLGLHGIEPTLVLNKFQPPNALNEELALDEERIASLAGGPVFAGIPREDRLLERVQLQAQDPWQIAPDSGFVRGVEELARHLIARREQAMPAADFVERRPTAGRPRARQ